MIPVMRNLVFAALVAACTPVATTVATLDSTSWKLVDVGGHAPVAGPDVTLSFADGNAEGFASCNQYRGSYTLSGSSLRFGPTAATKRACAEESRNAQETAYLGALAKAASFSISGDRLTLMNDAGAPLATFVRTQESR